MESDVYNIDNPIEGSWMSADGVPILVKLFWFYWTLKF